jgi:hypothetical protein
MLALLRIQSRKALNFLQDQLTWSSLNRIGQVRILRTSYIWFFLVPAVAKLLANIGPEPVFHLGGIRVTLGLPFSWKWFYFSAVAFSIASLFYSILCPPIVRDYNSFSDFRAEGRGGLDLVEQLGTNKLDLLSQYRTTSYRRQVIESEWYKVILDFIERFSSDPFEIDQFASPEVVRRYLAYDFSLDPDNFADAFWFVRRHAEKKNPVLRLLCGLCYLIGFLFISMILVQNFLYVLRFTL